MITGAARTRRRQPGRRDRQQRRLSAAAFPAARRAGARHRAGRQRRRGRASTRASRRWSSSSACELADELVAEGKQADLIVGNNVLAQVPDLNDFVAGMAHAAEAGGRRSRSSFRISQRLIEREPVRHHLSRALLLFLAGRRSSSMAARHGLKVFDVEELADPRRIAARLSRARASSRTAVEPRVDGAARARAAARLRRPRDLRGFRRAGATHQAQAAVVPDRGQGAGKTICGYGAPGKGNTLLNYCGIGTDFLDFTVDRNPYKHGRFTPGMHIPILPGRGDRRARSPTTC